ncbi:major facilitator superfamily domain-containing protein [Mycena amicta]|nr:major facilitator superfamily domain-containing protein [Mycena amicta]
MATTANLERSDTTTTGTSYSTDIIEKEKPSQAVPPDPNLHAISEEDEADNVGYHEYKQGLAEHAGELSPEENSAIRWRIDLIILPIFLVTQTLQFLDKTALNYANLFGFQAALHLKGNQFNWLSAQVYFGYAVAQYPIQILIGRYSAQKVLAITVFMWGLCVLTMTQCTNFHTAMINRFVLGMFEASVSPGLTLMTCQELPLRQFICTFPTFLAFPRRVAQSSHAGYSGLGWGGVIGSYTPIDTFLPLSLTAHTAGISRVSPTAPGPARWQYIFYILGAVTMAWAFVIWFLLPDSPASARWLNPRMRLLAVQRVAGNQLGIKNRKFKKEQLWVAAKDVKIWILFSSVFAAAIPNGVVTTKTTVLKSVGDITQIVALLIGGIITLNIPNTRLLASTTANIICVVAAATMAYLPREHVWGRLVSFWLVNCQSVGFAAGLVMVSSNMGGYTHRTIASAVIFTAYCFGNVAGPFVVKQSQAPFYQDATAGLLAGYTIKLVCQIVLLIYLFLSNRRRNKKYGPPDVAASKEAGMQDKTEYENKVCYF